MFIAPTEELIRMSSLQTGSLSLSDLFKN